METLTFEDSLTLHVGAVRVELEFVGPAHTPGDPFAGLGEAGRLVGNLARAYSELEEQPWGTALPLAPVAAAMAQFAGDPLRSLA